jgi:transposase InsO family protein
MKIHKNTKSLPSQREEMIRLYEEENLKASVIAERYVISERRLYEYIRRHRKGESLKNRSSLPHSKVIPKLQNILRKKLKTISRIIPKRYQKKRPGEMVHFDTKRLPFIRGFNTKEYLFVGIDDFSRELRATILPDKSQYSSRKFLKNCNDTFEYRIEIAYSDNGKEYKGTEEHEFVKFCMENDIKRRYTRKARPQTNGKAERVIRTLLQMWHRKNVFMSPEHRKQSLRKFVDWYNKEKPHASLDGHTPQSILENYFSSLSLNNV